MRPLFSLTPSYSLQLRTGADDACEIVMLFLYSYQAFLSPRARPSSVPGVLLQLYARDPQKKAVKNGTQGTVEVHWLFFIISFPLRVVA